MPDAGRQGIPGHSTRVCAPQGRISPRVARRGTYLRSRGREIRAFLGEPDVDVPLLRALGAAIRVPRAGVPRSPSQGAAAPRLGQGGPWADHGRTMGGPDLACCLSFTAQCGALSYSPGFRPTCVSQGVSPSTYAVFFFSKSSSIVKRA